MKITLDLKEFQSVIELGTKAMLNSKVHITEIITPFGTFHLDKSICRRRELYDILVDDIKNGQTIAAIKNLRLHIGCGLKLAKDFVEKLRDDKSYLEQWLNGDDEFIKANFDDDSYQNYRNFLEKL